MLKAEENTDNWLSGDLCGFEDLDKFSIDIDSLYEILSEQSDDPNLQSSPEELSCKKSLQSEATPGEINHGSFLSQNGVQEYDAPQGGLAGSSVCYPSENLEPTDSRAGMLSECMFEFPENSGMVCDHVNMESACDFDSPRHTCSLSLGDWSTSYVEHDTCSSIERDEGAMNSHFFNSDSATINQFPNCGSTFNFAAEDTNHVSGCTVPENLIHLKNENGYKYMHAEGDNHSKCASHVSDITMTEESHMTFNDDCTEDLEALVRNLPASEMDITFTDAEMSLPNSNPSAINHSQAYDASNQSSMRSFSECFDIAADREKFTDSSKHFQSYRFDYPFDKREEVKMPYRKIEGQPLPSESMCTTNRTKLEAEAIGGISVAPESSSMAYIGTNNCQDSFSCPSTAHCSPVRVKSLCEPVSSSSHLLPGIHTFILSEDLVRAEEKLSDKLFASEKVSNQSWDVINEAFEGGYHSPVSRSPAFASESGPCVGHASSHMVPDRSLVSSKQLKACVKGEKMDTLASPRIIKSHSTTFNCQIVKKSSSACSSQVDDDPDICILEDISDPRNSPLAAGHVKSLAISEHTASDSHYLTGSGSTRFRTVDERLTFRVALQDLSQPKTEASPPNGVLSVPLMRHQRIALSWMVQKETASLHCSGGILADDQGLGKTISTIALILKERPPSSRTSSMTPKQNDTKALNLDDDDDDFGVRQLDVMNQDGKFSHKGLNSSSTMSENAIILTKGRPAAGTLIVCPTSVLRQWAEELHNKVTKEAELSVLVYHGSNRTKDPLDLVKYDVVVTTYSIVSMEVPKQPLVDKDDDEKVKSEDHGLSSMESSCKKRKYPPSCSNKKSRKDKKGTDGSLLESAARPLARVGWFRVVLDEAQSIKNHRTQVARACWGLRAKRRWCLSGTPIQNAVDDLYSYFRFLRYDPYAGYKSFCSMIKVPINRNPTTGYKKLQAVLKTIMLRRTKGTHIDGEPIINLPPKSVELKKVDFSIEERDFYSKLEADSRAQFNVYAAAGTVQQNYVNILLMLLRLRQACDHPFLVKGYDSTSIWSSSLEMAKKLPSEKQTFLLSCLEACLAICAICNDSPEEAVVTICGHVFCNQCISEHLTGDDHLCPVAQCKVHLNATSVFSNATLKRSLFDQSEHDVSAAQLDEVTESCSEGFYSSKIKAALEVLESLSNPSDTTTKVYSLKTSNKVSRCQGNASDSHSVDASKDTPDTRIVNRKNDLDDSSTKVSEKAIVFSQWTRMLDLLEARLKTSSIQYRRLDGTMSVVARDKAVKDFNTLPEVTVMIMSLKAASLGLNMVAACHVLLLDLWWNPTTEDQAIDRAHRIGQTRPVTVLRLTVKDTVEDRILALQQKKREMVASAFGEDETGSRQSRLTVDDLKYLFMV